MKRNERNTNTSLMNGSPVNEPYKDEKQPYKTAQSSPTRPADDFLQRHSRWSKNVPVERTQKEFVTDAPPARGLRDNELHISEGISSIRS
jgi:hypothetical protein